MNKICCVVHKEVEALFYNSSTYDCLCEECCQTRDSEIISLSNDSACPKIIEKIASIQRFCDPSDIPNEFKANIEDLRALSLKALIQFHQKIRKLNLKANAFMKIINCPACNEKFSIINKPWILPCTGLHYICTKCKDKSLVIVCPYDNFEYSKDLLIEMFNNASPVPKCNECNAFFDLKGRIPKCFPCGYTICLNCLQEKYIAIRNQTCRSCKNSHDNYCSLENNDFFYSLIKLNSIYCSNHRNRFADYISIENLESLCSDCSERSPLEKRSLIDSKSRLYDILCERFTKLKEENKEFANNVDIKLEEYVELSNQQKLDKIREGLKPEKKDTFRSNIPIGKKIIEENSIENTSFLYRFFTLMPPDEFDPKYTFISKPWVLESDKNQIEAVAFKCSTNIKLIGIGIGQALNNFETFIEYLEIRKGKSLIEKEVYRENNNFKFDNQKQIQDIILAQAINITGNEFYNIKIKITGELLYRGNPFDLKEKQFGSDGSCFEFSELDIIGEEYINGQQDINGPIIKFLYQRI